MTSNGSPAAAASLPYPDADLRVHPPRNPHEQLGGLMFVPRTVDKVRAKLQGTLGFYKVGPGLSSYLFEWIGVTEEDFTEAVRAAKSDDDIAEYLRTHCDTTTFAEINQRLSERGIRDDEHFAEMLPRYPVLRDKPQLRNWLEILEADDAWSFDPANAAAVASAASS